MLEAKDPDKKGIGEPLAKGEPLGKAEPMLTAKGEGMPMAKGEGMPMAKGEGIAKGLAKGEPMMKGDAGMMKGKGGPPPALTPVPYVKLFGWGIWVVKGAMGSFAIATILGIVNLVMQQVQVQLLGAVVARLQMASAGNAAMAVGKKGGGGLSGLIPTDPMAAFQLLAVATVLGVGLILAERATTSWSDTLMLASLQRRLHDRLLELGPTYHQVHASGETSSIVWRYASGAQLLLRDLVAFPLVRGIALVTALLLLFDNLSNLGDTPLMFKLALIGGVLATPAVSLRTAKGVRSAFAKVRQSDVAATEELQNSLAQPLEVQLMGAVSQRSAAFADKALRHAKNRLSASIKNDLAAQARNAVPRLLQLGFLGYGVILAVRSNNAAAAGAVVAVHALVPLAIQPLSDLVQFFNSIGMAWPEVESVIEILEAPLDVTDPKDPVELHATQNDVVFQDVDFAYASRAKKVLDSVSYSFEAGKTTALVGASGSGKSTIFNLIARLSDPKRGSVSIGGIDVKNAKIADLRRRVVRVAQFPLFVADTVRANFKLAKTDATDEEIAEVCRATGLWDVLVAGSPDAPLDALLPRDVAQGLSGGQRRLLAVSRALLLRPSVLMLDEPSAGLDNITLQKLIRFLRTTSAGMTVLVIDHDLEGFVSKIADSIAILENGKIVASGTHEELMKSDNLYKRLVEAPAATAEPERKKNAP